MAGARLGMEPAGGSNELTAVGAGTVVVRTGPVLPETTVTHLLAEEDRRRLTRHRRPADRDRAASAWALLRRVVEEVTGQPAAAQHWTRHCVTCGGTDHGKPALVAAQGWHASLSSTAGMVAVALTQVGPVGIDVEAGPVFAGLADVLLAPGETGDLLQVWARKEAVLKATGHGLAVDPRSLLLDGTRVVSDVPGPVQLGDLALDLGVAAAVAVLARS